MNYIFYKHCIAYNRIIFRFQNLTSASKRNCASTEIVIKDLSQQLSGESIIQELRDELKTWKSKYSALEQLVSSLRDENENLMGQIAESNSKVEEIKLIEPLVIVDETVLNRVRELESVI